METRLNEALKKQNKQLKDLAEDLTRAEQRERRRISHLLHDELQQLLVLVKHNLESFGQDPNVKKMDRWLSQAIKITRSLATELNPPLLEESNPDQSLHWLAAWMERNYGLKVRVDADPVTEPVTEEMGLFLFQAMRELLFNVFKHSGTDCAQASLRILDNSQIRIRIKDEGKGFDAKDLKPSKGFGLNSIQKRIQCMGGGLKMKSAPHQGASFTLLAPLGRDDAKG